MAPKPIIRDPNLSITAAIAWSTEFARRFVENPPQGAPIYFLEKGEALLGLDEAIALSFSLPPSIDRASIVAAACVWNSATNTFDFPFKQTGNSLLDVLAITGLPIHAKPYAPGYFASTEFTYNNNPVICRPLKASFPVWRNYFIQHAERHEGGIVFLEYWLNKFIFCVGVHKPMEKWTKLAVTLYNGIEVGLGQPVLGALYRALHTLSLKPFHLPAGPLWILNLWL
ncbi:PREDICTED: uncharacterized protein LOC101305239 [Fragaria vesca subsp. vesca]